MFFYTAKTLSVISDSPFTDFSDFFKDLMGPEIFKQYRFCGKNQALISFYIAKAHFVVSDSPFTDFSEFFKDLMGLRYLNSIGFVENIKL